MKALGILVVVVVVLGALGLAVSRLAASPLPVQMAVVQRSSVAESLDQDGIVKSDTEVKLRSSVQARLEKILVKSGQSVSAGQLLVALEQDDLRAALAAARANERAAQGQVGEAQANLETARLRARGDEQVARATVQQAASSLLRVEGGIRPQEERISQAGVQRARAQREEASFELERKNKLFKQGFIPRSDVDHARTQFEVSQAAYREAQSSLDLKRSGARSEERGVAVADVNRAQAGLQATQATASQVAVAERQIETARARLEASRAQSAQAEANLRKTEIRAPVAGLVELENLQVGDMVTPATTVARVVDPTRLWVEVLVDESDRARIRPQQGVRISCDAYPKDTFPGMIEWIDSQAFLKREVRNSPTQDEDRVFRTRVRVKDARSKLFPGMSVFAEIVLRQGQETPTLPRLALVTREGDFVVYLVQSGRVYSRKVKIGQRGSELVEILEGVKEGDTVVVNPGLLKEGAAVRDAGRK